MLELEGQFSVLDVLQILAYKPGEYEVRFGDEFLHIANGNVTFYSGGSPEKCVRAVARYRGAIKVRPTRARRAFSFPVDELVVRAIFEAPGEERGLPEEFADAAESVRKELGEGVCLAIFSEGGEPILLSGDEAEARRCWRVWEISSHKLVPGLRRLTLVAGQEICFFIKARHQVLMGKASARVGVGPLQEALDRLARKFWAGNGEPEKAG